MIVNGGTSTLSSLPPTLYPRQEFWSQYPGGPVWPGVPWLPGLPGVPGLPGRPGGPWLPARPSPGGPAEPKIVSQHLTNSETIKEEKQNKRIMWSWGSICHAVIIPSIFTPPPLLTLKQRMLKKAAAASEMSREPGRLRQTLAEEQPSRASVFLFTWEKLTHQDSLQQSAQISNQYYDCSSMCQTHSTTNISQRQKRWRRTFLRTFLSHQT